MLALKVLLVLALGMQSIQSQSGNQQAEYNCKNACSVLQDSGLVGNCLVQCIQIYNSRNPSNAIPFPPPNTDNNQKFPFPLPSDNNQKQPTPINTNNVEIVTTTVTPAQPATSTNNDSSNVKPTESSNSLTPKSSTAPSNNSASNSSNGDLNRSDSSKRTTTYYSFSHNLTSNSMSNLLPNWNGIHLSVISLLALRYLV